MNFSRCLLLSALTLSLVTRAASADEPSIVQRLQHHVDAALVKPLVAQDRATPKFSRSSPPSARRARITSTAPATDAKGNAFLTFALDSKYGRGDWQDDMTGCVYVDGGAMYLAFGAEYQPAAVMLGKDGEATADVCKAVAPST